MTRPTLYAEVSPWLTGMLAVFLVGAAGALGAVAYVFAGGSGGIGQEAAVASAAPAAVLAPGALQAKAAVLYDPANGRVLFAKDADEPLPLASLTKLMTALVVLNAVPPQKQVVITPADLLPGGDWDGGLRVGDAVSIDHLLKLGLIASSNDAMTAAASSVPNVVSRMNATAQTMGLAQLSFFNPTGLDVDATTAGAYGSAYDIARLAAAFYQQYPQYFQLTQQASVSTQRQGGEAISGTATAAPLLSTPGFVGAKTGYTDLAGGNLVVVFDVTIGRPLVGVVLGSTLDGRFTDMLSLISAARATQP